jgi:hypothetical protein
MSAASSAVGNGNGAEIRHRATANGNGNGNSDDKHIVTDEGRKVDQLLDTHIECVCPRSTWPIFNFESAVTSLAAPLALSSS